MQRILSIGTFLILLTSAVSFSQDGSFDATVDKNPVGVGDQFTLSFTLRNAGAGGGKNLQLPELGQFRVMSGPNQSSSMQFINGAVSSSITYSYILQPKEMGKFTIGAASIEAGGNIYKTAPIALEVVKGAPRSKTQANEPSDVSGQIGDNVFLKATVDKTTVMQGEQINLTFKLYTRVSISNYAVDKNPAMTGFWSEDVENPKNIALTNEVVNGKQYRVGVIRRLALFPTQSGNLEISPMEVKTTVQIQSRSADPFDAFFRDPFGQSVNHTVRSEPLRIRVQPLPGGAPDGFKGAVGRFTMNASVDKQTAKANDAISLKVTIAGTGNVKLLESPEVELPTDFEQYTPKVSDNIDRQSDRISGSKTFEYVLIPRYPGRKVIKPVTFSFFDLTKREYVTLRSSPIGLTVEPGAPSSAPFVSGGAREDVRLLSQDIRFIKVGTTGLARRGEYLYTRGAFVVMLVLPLFAFAGAFVYVRQRQAEMMDEAGYRNRRAIKVAQQGLKQAEHLLRRSSSAPSPQKLAFYAEVTRALYKYLGDKLNIQPAEMSIEGVEKALTSRAVNGTLPTSLRLLLESCEMARFAPTSLSARAMRQTYDEARRVIIELERTLKSK